MPPQPLVALRRGFWCTATTRSAVTGAVVSTTGTEAATVTQAIRLVRVSLRTLTPALAADEAARAFRWLALDQWDAVHRLYHGGVFTLTFQYRDAEIEWCVRPVVFLPRCSRGRCR